MFHKKNRLAKTRDVKTAFERGRGFFNSFFTIKYLATAQPVARFTVVVSTKVSKKAVTRNRLKRLVREFIRKNMSLFSSGDYAIVIKSAAVKAEPKDLVAKFDVLTKASKLQKR